MADTKQQPPAKQVVHYQPSPYDSINLGGYGFVVPIDHPDTENVTNGTHVMTSEVLDYDAATGEFETVNTFYVPAAE